MKKKKSQAYTAKDIYVLKGLEPVRKRPAMYIGSTGIEGLHHLIWECVDNSIDEAVAGYAKNVRIELFKGARVRVSDDGRGIPVEKHPRTGKSALETVMTMLHAGAKFGGKVYKVSGGLHGVGVSMVNALSSYLRAEVCRDGFKYAQEYQFGKPKTKLVKVGRSKTTGTTIEFVPDNQIFKVTKFNLDKIIKHLRQQAYLTPGLRFQVIDWREKAPLVYGFCFEGGVKSFLKYLIGENQSLVEHPFYVQKIRNNIQVEVALVYTNEIETEELSFVNNIYTSAGGTHLTGFRTALTKVINDFARKNNYLKEKDSNFSGDDVREGMTAIVSVRVPEPQFEGQTKAKLGTPEVRTVVESVVSESFSEYLERYPKDAKNIIEKCLLTYKSRKAARIARESVLKKGVLAGVILPGKLSDCSSKKPENRELFIVEGESAGGSAKQARDREIQAILPLRGKILNVEKARIDKILSNQEIKALVTAIGTSIGDVFNLKGLRYHKIIIMTDADVDGAHIRTLLLTLFYRYFKPVIDNGHLYIAQPPLYKIQSGKHIEYVYTESDKQRVIKSFNHEFSIQRYKGLGEMNPEQLWETTMNPETRILKQVTIEDAKEADRLFDILMGEAVAPRKRFILTYATAVKNLDI